MCVREGKWFSPSEFEIQIGKVKSKNWHKSILANGKPIGSILTSFTSNGVDNNTTNGVDNNITLESPITVFSYQANDLTNITAATETFTDRICVAD